MKNCRTLADGFLKNGYTLVSGMPPIHRFKLISTHTFHRGYRQPSLVGGPQAPGKPIPSYFTLNTPAAGYWWRPCWGTPRGLQHNCEQEYRPWWYQTACTWWTSNWHPCAHYPRFKGEKPQCTLYLRCKRWLIALFCVIGKGFPSCGRVPSSRHTVDHEAQCWGYYFLVLGLIGF